MENPDSLMVRVLKAKYFKRTHFLRAHYGTAPSDIWRGLVDSTEVLLAGGRWRIGNGANVFVYKDRWIKNIPEFRIHYGMQGDMSLRVHSLFDYVTRKWKQEKLYDLFPVQVAEAISNTPIGRVGDNDKLIWCTATDGQYSIKSGYYVAKNMKIGTGQAETGIEFQHWGKLWKLQVTPAVTFFVWKLCKGLLGTRDNLNRRAWKIWCNRNRTIFESTCAVGKVAAEQIRWWMQENRLLSVSHIRQNYNKFGYIARDDRGNVIHAASGRLGPAEDVLQAEALPALRALSWAADMNVERVCLEGDYLILIKELQTRRRSSVSCGLLIKEIKELSRKFSLCSFQFVRREGNKAAHILAAVRSNLSLVCFTFNSLSCNIASQVHLDVI
ncbi:uncharacterized protein [Rutidosis leptorrhynchoides]|uniref:uncharacterized protein n=1 Tax=Rutidosis leptorrhynchoides TaxID=125765 RepID=UPI003A9A2F7C